MKIVIYISTLQSLDPEKQQPFGQGYNVFLFRQKITEMVSLNSMKMSCLITYIKSLMGKCTIGRTTW